MRRIAIAVLAVVVVVAIGLAWSSNGRADAGPPGGKPIWRDAELRSAPQLSLPHTTSLAPLIKQLRPAVVNVSTTTVTKNPHAGAGRGPGGGGGFEEFFEFFGREMPREFKGTSLGSGFVVNPEGYVLTNNHVVKDASDIKVTLNDGREFDAKVVGRDPSTDVALIKLENASGLPTVALGDSDALEQGDFVLAIGNPLGLSESATFGMVSAKGRNLDRRNPFDDFIQTDAAINQGNSGGPLFNLRGEVVGINTAIVSPQIGQGIGFAVPINTAQQVMPQLLSAGKVARGYLGVRVSELTPDLASGFRVSPGTKGAVIQQVEKDTPAGKAGVQAGDIVVALNGKPVATSGELTRGVSAIPPGGKANLTLLRGGAKKEIAVTVGQRPGEDALGRGELEGEEQGGEGTRKPDDKLGIRVAPLTPELAQRLGAEGDNGVVVSAVTPEGSADKAGIRRGDVILEVNRQPVSKVDQLVGIVGKMKTGETALLRIRRGQEAIFVAVRLGGEKAEKKK